jgi:hypothetical protein
MTSPCVILRSVVFQGRIFEVGRVYRYFYESYSVHLVFLVLNIKVADTRNFTGYNLQTLTLYDNDPMPFRRQVPGCLASFSLSENFVGQAEKIELIA